MNSLLGCMADSKSPKTIELKYPAYCAKETPADQGEKHPLYMLFSRWHQLRVLTIESIHLQMVETYRALCAGMKVNKSLNELNVDGLYNDNFDFSRFIGSLRESSISRLNTNTLPKGQVEI